MRWLRRSIVVLAALALVAAGVGEQVALGPRWCGCAV
jgi:hypothetical protein